MHIPVELRNSVERVFAKKGTEWLAHLDEVVDACKHKWALGDCTPVPGAFVSLVCHSTSDTFGQVVLKIGVPHRELFTEIEALSIFDGRNICRCYDSDTEMGALILERIIPGTDLTSLDEPDRTRIAAEVIARLPVGVPAIHNLPTFAEWLEQAFQRARSEDRVGRKMLRTIDAAERFYAELQVTHREQAVLHGDLHHKNILLAQDGEWKAIDPKGVIGMPCMEAGRYINNQLEYAGPERMEEALDHTTSVIGERLGESARSIALCAFIDMVLGTCWSFEGNTQPGELRDRVAACAWLSGRLQ